MNAAETAADLEDLDKTPNPRTEAGRPMECNGCMWWRRVGETAGRCQARSPRFMVVGDQQEHQAAWPVTVKWDYCGDWAQRQGHQL